MKIRIVGVAVVVAVIVVILRQPGASQVEDRALEDRVDKTVREYGVVESAQTVRVANELPEEMTLVSIVPEGTVVKKGDLVAELEDSELRDLSRQAQFEVTAARAFVQQAAQESDSARKLAQHVTELNELKLKVAQLNQTRYLGANGVFEVSLRDARREASVAEARLNAITNRMARQRQVQPAVAELETLDFEARQAREEAAKAQDQVQLLTAVERPYQTALLDLAVSQAKVDLLEQEAKSQTNLLQAESQSGAAKLELARAESKLGRIEDQLAKCRMQAPQNGVVIYTTPARRAADAVEAGAKVAAGQPLFAVSDLGQLRVRANVHESRILRVKKGQPVRLKLDAFPNRTYRGEVLSVNPTPEPAGFFEEGGKTYAVLVSIDAPPDQLRLGLSALVEIDTQ